MSRLAVIAHILLLSSVSESTACLLCQCHMIVPGGECGIFVTSMCRAAPGTMNTIILLLLLRKVMPSLCIFIPCKPLFSGT